MIGHKSVVCVGDLYQLPAVAQYRNEEQVFLHPLWPRFHFLELVESCRVDPNEKAFALMLSHLRLGHEFLTAEDKKLLERCVCSNHCHKPEKFLDKQRIKVAIPGSYKGLVPTTGHSTNIEPGASRALDG